MKKKLKYIFFLCFVVLVFSSKVCGKIFINPIQESVTLNFSINNISFIQKSEYKKLASVDGNHLVENQKLDQMNNSVLCSGRLGNFLKDIFHLVKFAVPILIIGLGIMDFIKAMTAQSQDEIKKASSKLMKRIIIGMIIFVLPTLIDFLLKIAEINSQICGW